MSERLDAAATEQIIDSTPEEFKEVRADFIEPGTKLLKAGIPLTVVGVLDIVRTNTDTPINQHIALPNSTISPLFLENALGGCLAGLGTVLIINGILAHYIGRKVRSLERTVRMLEDKTRADLAKPIN